MKNIFTNYLLVLIILQYKDSIANKYIFLDTSRPRYISSKNILFVL